MLREELQKLAECETIAQPASLKQITRNFPNSIRIIESRYLQLREQYTCLEHVLDFVEKNKYLDVLDRTPQEVFAGTNFVHWMIESGHLTEITEAEAQEDDLIFYFLERKFRHAGLWCLNGRVCSKWGTKQLFNHEILQIPLFYGTEFRFFRQLTYEIALKLFEQFAFKNELPFEHK